ncbi:hypothetical protein RGQ13_04075 [Thalassotalea psychrophila]|uniref:Uncharacterized protein n=1 Tax=Thalassotalea psychrophila TaxID=3065647 RepID=A0ABY9TWE5_9GAMM|nr:hypothetical protein RGQ13_04075 [Colwelliaceae bacterium SQ149]
MTGSKIIENAEANIGDDGYQENISANADKDLGKANNAVTRKRIDELLEKKRLKELLDEDEWEL